MRHDPALLELARRVVRAQQRAGLRQSDGAYERFRAILGAEQLALIDDASPLVAAHPGRRGGKTTAFIGKALQVFDKRARAAVAYFAPSDEQGVDIVWDDLRDYNARFELGLSERWTDRTWTKGARKLEVFGFNDRKDVERARGRKFDLVWLDEAQLGPDWFARQVQEAILPTTIDYLGQTIATGTPGPVASGFFFDACHERTWSNRHHWTAAQNPFFKGRDPLREARERFNLREDSASYRREWLGQWVVDPDELVYCIPDAAVRPFADICPTTHGYVIGLDFGFKDRDALAVVAVDGLRQRSHLVHIEEMDGKQTNHRLFAKILALQERFPGPVVFDPAGHTTNKTIETFRVDAPKVIWVAADKRRKVEYIDLLNNDLRSGTTFVEPGSLMLKEALRLRWKRPGKVAEDADHTDLGDAWLYSWRYARDWLRALPEKKPRVELDPFEEHMRRMAEQDDGRSGYFAGRLRGLS